jgi:hypothetical protein
MGETMQQKVGGERFNTRSTFKTSKNNGCNIRLRAVETLETCFCCSGGHGVGGVAAMEWGERGTAAAAEKKRANGGGAVEAPAAAMRNEE